MDKYEALKEAKKIFGSNGEIKYLKPYTKRYGVRSKRNFSVGFIRPILGMQFYVSCGSSCVSWRAALDDAIVNRRGMRE